MIKYVIKNIILVIFTVAVAVVAIWLPGYLLVAKIMLKSA